MPSRNQFIELVVPFVVPIRWRVALRQFVLRAIRRRYRMSAFGFLWTIMVPLVTLGIYGFVFGVVMRSDFGTSDTSTSFIFRLFAGLAVFWLMADVMAEAPAAIVQHANLVKRAVFPLEILPITIVGSAIFQTLINMTILLTAMLCVNGHLPLTALLMPVILLPFILLMAGFSWLLAALGVYFRDLAHVIGLLLTLLLFMSPVFYSGKQLSPAIQTFISLNPISFIVLQSRRILLDGQQPDWSGLGVYALVAWVIASLSLAFFQKARGNFADVL